MNIKININGYEVIGHEGQTLLAVASQQGINIPTLCHHELVTPQGACGLCVVEVERAPRLLRACATEITEGMVIRTDSPRVRASRQAALELLLSAHTGDCRPPCLLACPAQTDCQGYIGLIANGQIEEAVKLMKEAHPLPASIGRICPHPCETECRRQWKESPVNIAELKYFAADLDLAGNPYQPPTLPDTGKSVAIAGGGPAGLTAAYFLKRAGHRVTVYDIMPQMGGLLRYGIPEYRLPKAVLNAEIQVLSQMGITFQNGVGLGRDISLTRLRETYDAVIIATGAGISKKMSCPGETLPGVIGGIDFLRDAALQKPMTLGKRVAVVGGSNTAMDAARTAVRMGIPEVYVLYRRSREEMPADPAEVLEAEAEGVIFKFLVNPIEITGNGKVEGLRLQQMALGEPDAGGRRSPVPVPGAEVIWAIDTVIAAIGQDVDRQGIEDLSITKRGAVSADKDSYSTGIPGVYAIGDVTGQSAYAIEAIGHARKAAAAVHAYLSEAPLPWDRVPGVLVKDIKTRQDFVDEPTLPRETAKPLPAIEAKQHFRAVKKGLTTEQAMREAHRCLSCGCGDFHECKLLALANQYKADAHTYDDPSFEKPKKNKAIAIQSPYFGHNPDKCILCGLCVRVCDEVMGRTALGIMNRGFKAEIAPAFDLFDQDCIHCGQCVSLCPTGALYEKLPLRKPLTVKENPIDSVCSFCSLGCSMRFTAKGSVLLRALPAQGFLKQEKAVLPTLLCARGRFGFGWLNKINQSGKRLLKPLLRQNGRLTETDWVIALETIQNQIRAITAQYGPASIGIALSDSYTLEDAYAIQTYASQAIGTPHIFTFNGKTSGLQEVMGCDASTNRFEELQAAEVILLYADDIMETHPIAGIYIKKAVENGAKLIIFGNRITQADEWAHMKITTDSDLSALRQMTKAIATLTQAPNNADGYAELCEYLSATEPREEIQKAAALYVKAKSAITVFDQSALSLSAARLIADMAVLAGKIGRPRSGVIQLKPNSNSQGLVNLGIQMDTSAFVTMIRKKTLRGLLIFGEDIPHIDLTPLSFLAVQDLALTETAEKADVVLPGTSFAESEGHYTDTTGITRKLHPAVPLVTDYTNRQIMQRLAGRDTAKKGTEAYRQEADSLYCDMLHTYPALQRDEPVLYRDGIFTFPNGRARLRIPCSDVLYDEPVNTQLLRQKADRK